MAYFEVTIGAEFEPGGEHRQLGSGLGLGLGLASTGPCANPPPSLTLPLPLTLALTLHPSPNPSPNPNPNPNPEHSDLCVAVGLCTDRFPLDGRMPGWDYHSCGFHGEI